MPSYKAKITITKKLGKSGWEDVASFKVWYGDAPSRTQAEINACNDLIDPSLERGVVTQVEEVKA